MFAFIIGPKEFQILSPFYIAFIIVITGFRYIHHSDMAALNLNQIKVRYAVRDIVSSFSSVMLQMISIVAKGFCIILPYGMTFRHRL